jgi:hypothetical protein
MDKETVGTLEDGAFRNMVMFFLNQTNATLTEVLKNQCRILSTLESLRFFRAPTSIDATAYIDSLSEDFLKINQSNIEILRNLMQETVI